MYNDISQRDTLFPCVCSVSAVVPGQENIGEVTGQGQGRKLDDVSCHTMGKIFVILYFRAGQP